MAAAGCTRKFYRERTDDDVNCLIQEKAQDPRWALDSHSIYPQPQSRFSDTDPYDHPHRPYDDPGVEALSPNPQPIRSHFHTGPENEGAGYLEYLRQWNEINRLRDKELKPKSLSEPVAQVPLTASEKQYRNAIDRVLKTGEEPFKITLDQSTELALFNSREYQDRREDLYLSALPVTMERFSFVSQFFATENAVRTWAGVEIPEGKQWLPNTTVGVNQLFPTGATLLAQLANRLVIDLGTQKPSIGISNLTLELTQPLLRGGGWAVTLEPLTQSERTLVYGVRSFARFRKNYYVYLAGGADVFNSPYSYAGLNLRGVGPSLNAPSQGFLPTLLSVALERNERDNIISLVRYLNLFREYQGKGDFSELQVGQVELQLLRGQSTLLQRRQELQNGLDSFKLQLGLPTQLPLELDDSPLIPVFDHMERFTKARDEFIAVRTEAEQYALRARQSLYLMGGGVVTTFPITLPLREKLEEMMFRSPLVEGTEEFKKTIAERWSRWRKKSNEEIKSDILKFMEEQRTLEVREASLEAVNQELTPQEKARIDELPKEIALGQFEQSLREYDITRQRKGASTRDVAIRYESTVNLFTLVLTEARTERQSLVRALWPKLPRAVIEGTDMLASDLDRSFTVASQYALANRFELMNARGQLVDNWRKIAVNANALLGVVNVGYNLNAFSPPNINQPFAVGGAHSRHQLILTGELPLVRRAERNEYRVALIAYQRSRRNVQASEDFILNDVRVDLRQLRVLAENYRIQQRAVEVAYDQVENALDVLQAPPTPVGGAGQPGGAAAQSQQSAANAAALTLQLLNAQTSLLQAQNSLYTVWVNYLIARMTFYRDLELLPLDSRGVWIDEQSLPTIPSIFNPLGSGEGPPAARFAEER
jgi:hypothetical protein